MRCASCKRSVPDDAEDCPFCGAALRAEQKAPQHRPGGAGASLLVVDDDVLVLTLLSRVLAKAGYMVVTANGCEQAAQQLSQRRFDVVLTDLVMPGPGGAAVVAQARQALPDALIVCMSGQADISLVGAAREAGADELLVKPFSPQAVVDQLGHLLALKRDSSRGGMPPGLAGLLRSRACPKCHGSNWRLTPHWSEWRAPIECANCGEVMFNAGRCHQCGDWGIEGETYSEAFGLCGRCATAGASP